MGKGGMIRLQVGKRELSHPALLPLDPAIIAAGWDRWARTAIPIRVHAHVAHTYMCVCVI